MKTIKKLAFAGTVSVLAATAHAYDAVVESVRQAPYYSTDGRTFGQVFEYAPVCNDEYQSWSSTTTNDGRPLIGFWCAISDDAIASYAHMFKHHPSEYGEFYEANVTLYFTIGADDRIYPYQVVTQLQHANGSQYVWESGDSRNTKDVYRMMADQRPAHMGMFMSLMRLLNKDWQPN